VHTLALLCLLIPRSALAADPAVAWFTDAEIAGAVKMERPAVGLPEAPGTNGKGVRLANAVRVEDPLLSRHGGMISFWLRPDWDGDDGRAHRILRIGDPERNGLLVEKAATGMLRYVMASPEKMTAARHDVSNWRTGEWHHVAIAWFELDGKPLGLPLWIDKVAVDGPIAGGNTFMDPATMTDKRVWIGDATARAIMDELIFREKLDAEGGSGQVAVVYRDYFRTAPYTKIEIDPEPCVVPADRRVLEGYQKQFGLMCEQGGRMIRVTDFAVRYGQWAEFDAKPMIRWSTSDERIATVDKNGLVTGVALGKCKLAAEFRGMRASYDLEVIPVEQPDLDLLYVERVPKYRCDAVKVRPDPGDNVTSVAHIANFGFQPVPAGTIVRFELMPDTNRNFRWDRTERPVHTQEQKISAALAPREEVTVRFPWRWSEEPMWVRVTVDPGGKIAELCEANNECCELSTARPLRFAYNAKKLEAIYKDRRINLVGSFNHSDWVGSEKRRLDVMMREAVWPTTSPDGIRDAVRIDKIYPWLDLEPEKEQYYIDEPYYDGGFPVNEPVNLMAIDAAIIHEFGHTCLALPDLYGYPEPVRNVLLKDENGEYYAGGDLMPAINGHGTLPLTSANNVPCGVGYTPLMDFCHLWLHPAHAGQVQYFAGYRGSRFWGTQGRLIPTFEQSLQVYDINDKPLVGAAIYVYHVTQTGAPDAGTKYFADRPKFMGNTDNDGRFRFPGETDETWDDPGTDEVEGAMAVWNPFGCAGTTTGAAPDVAFTPNAWSVEGLLLIKIATDTETEFAWLPLTEFNEAFFRGEHFHGVYPIRTNLLPCSGVTAVVRPNVPEAIRERNLRPVAVVEEELTVACGERFTLDGSRSHDPEGQPLVYRWQRASGRCEPSDGTEAALHCTAPDEPGEVEYWFYVIDGLRVSEFVTVTVHVKKAEG
jgi:hypothetical protein